MLDEEDGSIWGHTVGQIVIETEFDRLHAQVKTGAYLLQSFYLWTFSFLLPLNLLSIAFDVVFVYSGRVVCRRDNRASDYRDQSYRTKTPYRGACLLHACCKKECIQNFFQTRTVLLSYQLEARVWPDQLSRNSIVLLRPS